MRRACASHRQGLSIGNDNDDDTSGTPSPYSPSSILILVNKGELLSRLLLGSTWVMAIVTIMEIKMVIEPWVSQEVGELATSSEVATLARAHCSVVGRPGR